MEKYFNILKVKNYNIIGSYAKPERKFFSDIDLEEVLDNYTPQRFMEKLKNNLIEIRKSKDIFFLDFKAGNLNGLPVKWTLRELIDGYRYIDNRRYNLLTALIDGSTIKLDVVVLQDDFIIPVTINWYFSESDKKKRTFADIYIYAQELKEKGDIFNYMKKMQMYYILSGKKGKALKINSVLNSDFGKIYKYIGILESILILLKSDNVGYSMGTIKNNFCEIKKELPKQVSFLMIPLCENLDKQNIILTIPKVIKGLYDYIHKNLKIDE